MQTHMPRLTFETAIGRCAISWNPAGLAGFELPEARPAATDEPEVPVQLRSVVDRVRRHLDGMRQSRTIKVIFAREKDLGLRLQLTESLGMNDPVAIDLERRPVIIPVARATTPLGVESSVKAV